MQNIINKKIFGNLKTKHVILVLVAAFAFLFLNFNFAHAEELTPASSKSWMSDFLEALFPLKAVVLYILEGFFAFVAMFLGITGNLFNVAVDIGVIRLSEIARESEAIKVGWTIIRDLVNILFIFGLLYISITTILQGWGDSSKKMLGRIIVAAMLINFSFFFTATLIDISNIISLEIKDAMSACNYEGENSSLLSNCFMEGLKIQGVNTQENEAILSGDLIQKITQRLAHIVFVVITATVFLIMSLALISRMIILLILLILSPLMFVGMILPKLSKVSNDWISKLTEQLVFLPVFFILLYVTYLLLIVGDGGIVGTARLSIGDMSWKDLSADKIADSTLNIVIQFVLVIGFLITAVVKSKEIAGKAADGISSTISNITFGGAAKFGRVVGGRVGKKITDSKYLKDQARTGKYGAKILAKTALKTGRNMAEGNWDTRTGLGKITGVSQALEATNANSALGKAVKTSYQKKLDAATKQELKDKKLWEKKKLDDKEDALIKATINTEAKSKAIENLAAGDDRLLTELESIDQRLADRNQDVKDAENRARDAKNRMDKGTKLERSQAAQDLNDAEADIAKAKAAETSIKKQQKELTTEMKKVVKELEKKELIRQNIGDLDNDVLHKIGKLGGFGLIGSRARAEAADKYRKELSKSETQKGFDSIKEDLKKEQKKDED